MFYLMPSYNVITDLLCFNMGLGRAVLRFYI
ncbi:hypothetical protein F888_03271 [Acinetobacter courvalinii]|uniref:Uncharacterized protein n=1 Tax=Acinetobacter courvalinii TaxID=280147 RepID=N9PT33_9GAMM|nr:hypothetical protein F888_03271 [Acinetobacter courvalinii]